MASARIAACAVAITQEYRSSVNHAPGADLERGLSYWRSRKAAMLRARSTRPLSHRWGRSLRDLTADIIRTFANRTGRFKGLYRRVARPDGSEWAAFLKIWGGLHSMGQDCYIQTDVYIGDPALIRLGDNVRLTGCALFGHDGSVNMVNRAYGLRLDRVGKIDIGSNVFVGYRAVVLPGVTIGDNVIVGAGAVVTRDLPSNSVAVGVPARRICSLDDHVERLKSANETFPWRPIIEKRKGTFDPELEPELEHLRVRHFYGEHTQDRDTNREEGQRRR